MFAGSSISVPENSNTLTKKRKIIYRFGFIGLKNSFEIRLMIPSSSLLTRQTFCMESCLRHFVSRLVQEPVDGTGFIQ